MSSSDDSDNGGEPLDRSEVLALLDDGIREAHRKVTQGRVHDPKNEEVRQGWIRALGYIAGQYRQLRKDEQLDDLEQRLEQIEQNQSAGSEFRYK